MPQQFLTLGGVGLDVALINNDCCIELSNEQKQKDVLTYFNLRRLRARG